MPGAAAMPPMKTAVAGDSGAATQVPAKDPTQAPPKGGGPAQSGVDALRPALEQLMQALRAVTELIGGMGALGGGASQVEQLKAQLQASLPGFTPSAPNTLIDDATQAGAFATPGTAEATFAGYQGPLKVPSTGSPQILHINGMTKYFDNGIDLNTGHQRADGMAYEITAYQYTEQVTAKPITDDGSGTLGTFAFRVATFAQDRLKQLQAALDSDSRATGTFNPVDLQKQSMETQYVDRIAALAARIAGLSTKPTADEAQQIRTLLQRPDEIFTLTALVTAIEQR